MAVLTVHWQHMPFSHDGGERRRDEIDGTGVDSVHTGVLSDEHQEVTDGSPVLIEDETMRVYRASDLPPSTQIVVANTTGAIQAIIDKARRAGFDVVAG